MKKLLFSAYSLDVGGIETALVTLLNELAKKQYEITLVLEKKQGIFLEDIDKKIKIIEYSPSNNKNVIFRKIINLAKRTKFILKYKNKFDFSASYATYSLPGSFVARTASKNSALWCHADYMSLYNNNKIAFEDFFESLRIDKFKKVIFVSKQGKNSFVKIFPHYEKKTIVCNNLINIDKILNNSKENIKYKKNEEEILFVNVGRHDEKQKKLSRIIEVSKKLKNNGYKFKVLFVGNGKDTNKYKELVKQNNLQNNIEFLGRKKNPYPYMKMADAIWLTSEYEGYPVVFVESMILNKPIITTKVSDYEEIKNKYGIITDNNVEDIYEKVIEFMQHGFKIENKFNAIEYNNKIIKEIEQLF